MKPRTSASRSRSGFSLIEIAISSSLLFVITGALVQQLEATRRQSLTTRAAERLQTSGEKALRDIGSELRKSGFVYANGHQYPHLYTDGQAGAGFLAYNHAVPAERASAGEPGHGFNRELIYARADMKRIGQAADGTNYCLDCTLDELDPDGMYEALPSPAPELVRIYDAPYIDPGSGTVRWSTTDAGFVFTTEASGRTALELRVAGVRERILARDVERVVFDTSTTDPVGVPVGAVRVRLWLQTTDDAGALHRWQGESVIEPRNE